MKKNFNFDVEKLFFMNVFQTNVNNTKFNLTCNIRKKILYRERNMLREIIISQNNNDFD